MDERKRHRADSCVYTLLPSGMAEIIQCEACDDDETVPEMLEGHRVTAIEGFGITET